MLKDRIRVGKIQKLAKEPLTRRAFVSIRDAILAGEYSPGQRLIEEELARALEVSRNVVREAFWQLEAQGLVQSDDYKGKCVVSPTMDDIISTVPLRLVLEPMAATWACRNIDAPAAERLRTQVQSFSGGINDYHDYAVADFELHQTIWRLSGNRQLAVILDRLTGPMIALQARIFQPLLEDLVRREVENLESSHGQLVAAICSGEPARARAAMQTHITGFWSMWMKDAAAGQAIAPATGDRLHDAAEVLRILSSTLDGLPLAGSVGAGQEAPEGRLRPESAGC